LRACLSAGEEGQSVLELAFMLPILMTLMVSIFYVGWSYNNKIVLTQAVGNAGAYLQAVGQGGLSSSTDPCVQATSNIQALAPNLNPANLNITYSINGAAIALGSGGTCASYFTAHAQQGTTVTVQATYPCSMAPLSGLANLISNGTVFGAGCLIQAQTTELIY
jgi:Flp pilus assembly protein TadG